MMSYEDREQTHFDEEDVSGKLEGLIDRQLSLLMATLDESGFPHLSYSPYAWVDGFFYVLMSQLAPHTAHVESHPEVEIMLIADERDTSQIYARERAQWRCNVEKVADESEESESICELMSERHGGIVELINSLGDFHLYRLLPGEGRYVAGFGKAYCIEGARVREWLTG